MGVRLPPEYQEVQYIQCSGYQYINTGVNLSSDDFEVFCRFAITQITGAYEQALFSIWTPEYNYWNCLMRKNLDISVYTAAHHTTNKRVVIGQMNNITVIRNVDTWSYVLDDDVVTWTYSPTKINDTPLTLCRRADIPNYANSATHARIYDFSVKANGTIVAKYVPCYRKSDNKPGMYDLVSGTFFVNQDTGEDFTVGPDVIDSISPWMVARRRMLMRQYIGYEENKGFTGAYSNVSTGVVNGRFLTGFIPINGAKRVTCYYGGNIASGAMHYMVEYNGDKQYTNKDGYWDMIVKNQRTVTLYTSDVQYVRFSGFMNEIDQCYVKNADTGEILWKKGM